MFQGFANFSYRVSSLRLLPCEELAGWLRSDFMSLWLLLEEDDGLFCALLPWDMSLLLFFAALLLCEELLLEPPDDELPL